MIQRQIEGRLHNRLDKAGIALLCGPRGCGKSFLASQLGATANRVLVLDGEKADPGIFMEIATQAEARLGYGGVELLIIDEAQRLHGIKPAVELISTALPTLKVLLLSSFLTPGIERLGRKATSYFLGPLSTTELYDHGGTMAVTEELPRRLVHGNYPEAYLAGDDFEAILESTCRESLRNDIAQAQDIRRPEQLMRLLGVLACKLGRQITYSEIARDAGMDAKTVERYLDLLEQAYLVFRLSSYSGSVRNELKRSFKVCFWDNGIRNLACGDFRPIGRRQDADHLWQNYFITERRKAALYAGKGVRQHFWRSTQKQEVGLVELTGRKVSAYGMRWTSDRPHRLPLTFSKGYPGARLETVNRSDYLSHTLEPQQVLSF